MIFICNFIIYAIIFILGACIFSFLNVIVYRLPKKMSFVSGRSICPTCHHQLESLDLIPVLSYLFLGGKCRYCKTTIGIRDTLVELLGGGAAILCFCKYERYEEAVTVFGFFCILTVVTFLDIDTMEIADGCHVAMVILAVVSLMTMPETGIVARLIGAVCISVPMLIITMMVPGAFGGGDIKLMAASGLFLGWKITLISAVLAILMGGIYGIYLLAAKKADRKAHFAFGPFLCVGMVIGLLFGQQLLELYLSTMLY